MAGRWSEPLADLARGRGCYGMWVGTEPDDAAALATDREYRLTVQAGDSSNRWTGAGPSVTVHAE